ncbi:hypothetical protein [Streptomyces sp. WZ-12]|uniref:hypothetical protein n=1 Tax=Streptomyces sp. WZ-12 TaxID=3030210 RepID=UPI0023811213|nr:hypothetical protein [Streptomyces sp. WZ-12]
MLVVEEIALGAGEAALYRELYAPTSVPVPELSTEPWPAPAGVLAGRRDGQLVGWVVFFAGSANGNKDEGRAVLQWIMAKQERERITTGYITASPASAADVDDLTTLADAGARQARQAGYTSMEWGPAEPGLAEGLATRLSARTAEDEDGFHSYRLAW